VDGASGNDAAHIPEWATNDPPISGKVSGGPDATFSKTGYDLQTPENVDTQRCRLCIVCRPCGARQGRAFVTGVRRSSHLVRRHAASR